MTEEEKQHFEKLVTDLQTKSSEETQRYIGALMEQYKWDMDAIKENLQLILKDIPEMKRMLEILVETTGQHEVDIEMLKEAYQNHEERLQKVESKR